MPPRAFTATSLVPPPTSTIIVARGSSTGSPAPIAAANGSSISRVARAPPVSAASSNPRPRRQRRLLQRAPLPLRDSARHTQHHQRPPKPALAGEREEVPQHRLRDL